MKQPWMVGGVVDLSWGVLFNERLGVSTFGSRVWVLGCRVGDLRGFRCSVRNQ